MFNGKVNPLYFPSSTVPGTLVAKARSFMRVMEVMS
jgi:hypothetical protein